MALINCKECNTQISADASVCPKCGKRLKMRLPFKIAVWTISILLGVPLAIGIVKGLIDTTSSGASTAQAEPAAMNITAGDLLSDYTSNEVAADLRFKGKRLRVSGTVESLGKDMLDSIYITMGKSEFRSVQVFFDGSEARNVARLSKGQAVTVEGDCNGLMMNVMIKNGHVKAAETVTQ